MANRWVKWTTYDAKRKVVKITQMGLPEREEMANGVWDIQKFKN